MPLIDTKNKSIILASKSPRRVELLKKVITHFEVQVSDIEEKTENNNNPAELVVDLSYRKADKVAQNYENAVVIGADSVVVLDGMVLGKPDHHEQSSAMLRQLSNKLHQVYSGITVIKKPGIVVRSDFAVTEVKFRKIRSWEIEKYIRLNKPYDKAGSYGIQDDAAVFVDRISGCYYNVMGLPINKLYMMLLEIMAEKPEKN